MGYYTELMLAVDLKPDIPLRVIEALDFIVNAHGIGEERGENVKLLNDYPFFKCGRWDCITADFGEFDGGGGGRFNLDGYLGGNPRLSMRGHFKNYDNETGKFLDWLSPWVASHGLVGWVREEGFRETPKMIVFADGEYILVEVDVKYDYDRMLDRLDGR